MEIDEIINSKRTRSDSNDESMECDKKIKTEPDDRYYKTSTVGEDFDAHWKQINEFLFDLNKRTYKSSKCRYFQHLNMEAIDCLEKIIIKTRDLLKNVLICRKLLSYDQICILNEISDFNVFTRKHESVCTIKDEDDISVDYLRIHYIQRKNTTCNSKKAIIKNAITFFNNITWKSDKCPILSLIMDKFTSKYVECLCYYLVTIST